MACIIDMSRARAHAHPLPEQPHDKTRSPVNREMNERNERRTTDDGGWGRRGSINPTVTAVCSILKLLIRSVEGARASSLRSGKQAIANTNRDKYIHVDGEFRVKHERNALVVYEVCRTLRTAVPLGRLLHTRRKLLMAL